MNCYVHDNVNEGIRDQAAGGSRAPNVVITGNIVPKGSGSFPQVNSMLVNSMLGIGAGGVVANNVLRGYGTGSDGTTSFDGGVIKQTTSPIPNPVQGWVSGRCGWRGRCPSPPRAERS
jgi:hypothetical protein